MTVGILEVGGRGKATFLGPILGQHYPGKNIFNIEEGKKIRSLKDVRTINGYKIENTSRIAKALIIKTTI